MQNSSTGLVASIALLMTLGAWLVGGFSKTGTWAMQANAFSSNSQIVRSEEEPPFLSDSQYVRIYIAWVAYEGTLHTAQ